MIRIKRGRNVLKVSRGAFKSIFSKIGYEPVTDENPLDDDLGDGITNTGGDNEKRNAQKGNTVITDSCADCGELKADCKCDTDKTATGEGNDNAGNGEGGSGADNEQNQEGTCNDCDGEVPISELNFEQLKAYAANPNRNINTKGMRSKEEIRTAIRAWKAEQENKTATGEGNDNAGNTQE